MLDLFSQVVQKQTLGEVETKTLFNSQLCQKYFCQKLLKSANLSSCYNQFYQGCFVRLSVYFNTYFA